MVFSKIWSAPIGLALLAPIICHGVENVEQDSRSDHVPSVFQRDAAGEKLSASTILSESFRSENPPRRRLPSGVTLGYVTPWNRGGYAAALEHAGTKIDLVSPCWHRISAPRARTGSGIDGGKRGGKGGGGSKEKSKHAFDIMGFHDVNATFVDAVRARGARVLPRISFDNWQQEHWMTVARDPKTARRAIRTAVRRIGQIARDGVVIDTGILPISRVMPMVTAMARAARKEIAKVRAAGGDGDGGGERGGGGGGLVVLAMPPHRGSESDEAFFSGKEAEALSPLVDYFSVMTYDYSNPARPGPNAPMPWVSSALSVATRGASTEEAARGLASKMLLGLNFYGNDYVLPSGGGPITGGTFVDIVRDKRPSLAWVQGTEEHTFSYSNGAESHRVFYPTPLSIAKRVDLAKELGTGIAIWELGQGLPYFFDTL